MNEKTSMIMTEFSARLKEVFAGDLLAVVLYGSAAGDAYNKDLSDINVLVILQKNSAAGIFKCGHTAKNLIRKNRISPIIMTREEFAAAADVFPLEYCDILETHTVVYGDREILNITVSRENLRLQLEEKLRGAAADIRSMLIAAGGTEKTLKKLILLWSSLGGVLFRGLLRLKEKNAAGLNAQAVLAEVEKEYKVSLESFSFLNRLRQNKKFNQFTASALAGMLLEPLMELIHTVDSMDEKTS